MNRKKIAERLLLLRGDRTQSDVALAVNVSVSALGMYERGERVPKDEIKVRLAKYYGTSVQDIFFTQE